MKEIKEMLTLLIVVGVLGGLWWFLVPRILELDLLFCFFLGRFWGRSESD